jgi:hypothetical protein
MGWVMYALQLGMWVGRGAGWYDCIATRLRHQVLLELPACLMAVRVADIGKYVRREGGERRLRGLLSVRLRARVS